MYSKQNEIQGCLKSYVTETGFYCGLKSRWQVHCERVVLSMYQHCPFLPIKISLHSQKSLSIAIASVAEEIKTRKSTAIANACSSISVYCFSITINTAAFAGTITLTPVAAEEELGAIVL